MKLLWSVTLPIKTVSEANRGGEHWTKKHKRHRLQKMHIKAAFLSDRPQITIPCTLIITRISPRELDSHDNLPVSLKYVSDELAALITNEHTPGRADSICGLQFKYNQKKGGVREYAVKIEIYDGNIDK